MKDAVPREASRDSSEAGGTPAAGLRLAVMQPYYLPYAGYFRLFAAADLVVFFDCVQFPRRGWLHRNQLCDSVGAPQWLTLPLEKAPQDVLIRDLRFRVGAAADMAAQFRRFPALATPAAAPLRAAMSDLSGTPLDHIERLLHLAARQLGLPWRVLRSSSLDIDPALRGQDRILAIATRLGAGCYLNPPGGRGLYEPARFAEAGIALRFLPPYNGAHASIAERLGTESAAAVAVEIGENTRLVE